MGLSVIGAGVGRTGTYSLKLAINELGLGPCHHMEEVLHDQPAQVPLWAAAVQGRADWEAIFAGYGGAVDWPTAGFFRELSTAYPDARFVLTVRSAESWVDSFSATIYRLLSAPDQVPPQMRPWFDMASAVIAKSGFPTGLDAAGLAKAFDAHNEAVKAAIPADRLLVYQVKEGWGPLCGFLGAPAPDTPFPRTNDRAEFWDRVAGKI
ncbi:sulfotransferase family protein [Phenylobacterium sp.]|uniref:sulfotransferase family protein n=1 Tax=Phenylobacterium sp. TaxID=1871053 RepID=UPI0035B4095B